jgi:hypothetical protein
VNGSVLVGLEGCTSDDSNFALEAGEVFIFDLEFCHGEETLLVSRIGVVEYVNERMQERGSNARVYQTTSSELASLRASQVLGRQLARGHMQGGPLISKASGVRDASMNVSQVVLLGVSMCK